MSPRGLVLRSAHSLPARRPGLQFKRSRFASPKQMNSRICRCCGEPMPEKGNPLSRNPNICASCSSMADGMEESVASESSGTAPNQEAVRQSAEAIARDRLKEDASGPAAHHVPL